MRLITRGHVGVILILLLTAILATNHLHDSIWTDEQRTLFYAGAAPHYGLTTLSESLARITENLWQAPAYYLLLWAWGRAVGWSVFALGIPSIFLGLLTIAITYRLASRYFSREIGFYAVALLALNGFFINFMYDMRAYMLFALLTDLMFWCYVFMLEQKYPFIGYPFFTITLTLLLYTHYFAIFPIAALGLCHLLFQYRQPNFWKVIGCFMVAGTLFLQWVQVLLNGTDRAIEAERSANNLSLIGGVSDIFYLFSNGSEAFLLLLLLLAAAARHPKNKFLAVWLVAAYGLLWGITRVIPAFTEVKYAIFFWSVLAVAGAVGIQHLHKLGVKPLFLLGLWVLMFAGSLISPEQQKRIHPFYTPPLQEIAAVTMPYTQPDDALLFVLPPLETFVEQPMLDYYFYGDNVLRTAVIRDTYATTDEFFQSQIMTAVADVQRIWLTYENGERNWRLGAVDNELLPAAGFATCGVTAENETLFAALYARQPASTTAFTFTTAENNPIQVYLLAPPIQDERGQLVLNMGWYVPAELSGSPYSFALHVEDEQGNFLAQADVGLAQIGFGCQLLSISVPDLSSGNYQIKATVYNWQTGVRLPSVEPAPDGERPIIASVMKT
jgi:hypothetical protein